MTNLQLKGDCFYWHILLPASKIPFHLSYKLTCLHATWWCCVETTTNDTETPVPRYVQEQRDFRSRYAAAIVNKVDGVVCLFCVWIYVNGKSQVLFYTKSKVGILLKQLNFIFN